MEENYVSSSLQHCISLSAGSNTSEQSLNTKWYEQIVINYKYRIYLNMKVPTNTCKWESEENQLLSVIIDVIIRVMHCTNGSHGCILKWLGYKKVC